MTTDTWEFDFFYSVPFWAALIVVATLARLAGSRARLKSGLLIVSSSALLLALPQFGARDLAVVWVFASVTWFVAHALARPGLVTDPRKRRGLAASGILAVLCFLAFFKYRFLQDLLLGWPGIPPVGASRILFLLGVSYSSFKVIHVLVEAYRQAIPGIDPLTYLNYITFFPAFISGPINRYPHFAEQLALDGRRSLRADLATGGQRIVHGLFKKLVLVQLVYPHILTQRMTASGTASAPDLAIGLYTYALYTYFDFAAYSDLAIGGARLLGVELPENFDRPFFQRNIRELWSHWHMSFTSWLVEYIYWPVVRSLRNLDFFRTRPVTLSIVGMNVTFLACGAWHGEGLNFILWGLYHGVGISIAQVYQRQKKRIRSRALQRYFASPASRAVGAFGTFHFFVAGLTLFALDLGQLRALLASLAR